MGMFTTAKRKDGLWLQFYGGNDFCNDYRIGDEVPQWVDENQVGSEQFMDGAYYGYGNKQHGWVTIKDGRVYSIDTEEELGFDGHCEKTWPEREKELCEKYEIAIPAYESLFTEEAWQNYLNEKARRGEEFEEYCQFIGANTEELRLVAAITWPISCTMNYQNIGRKLLCVDDLPQNILPKYTIKGKG